MYRHIQKLRLILLFGIILKTQITVSQDFRFGRPGLGDANFGGQFGRGGFGGGPGQFRGGGPRFQGLTPGRRNGLGFGGVIDGGTTVLGEGGTLGSRFGNGLGGANTRTMQGFGFGGNGQPGRDFQFPGAVNGGLLRGGRMGAVDGMALGPQGLAAGGFNGFGQEFDRPFSGTFGGGLDASSILRQQRRRLATPGLGAGSGRATSVLGAGSGRTAVGLGPQSTSLFGGLSQDSAPLFLDPITGQNVRVLSNNAANNAIRSRTNDPTVARAGMAGTNIRRGIGRTAVGSNIVVQPGTATARRVSPALAARRRTVAAARARAVPPTLNNLFANAVNMTEVNRALGLPVPIPRTTTTTTTTPRPPESVNWLGFTNPLQRRRQAATRQSFNTRNNVPRNNRRFQQQRQNSNRNVLDRRRNVGQNLGQFSQRAQNIQRFPSRTSSRRQSVNRLRPVPRLQNINNVGRAPTAPPRRVSEDSSLMREFRRQLDRRNRERIQNVQALQRASNTARLSDVRSQRFDTRQENLLDANRQFRRRPVSSNLLRDTELQPGRQSVRSDNRLALTNQQLQEMEMTLNEPGLPRTASTLGRRIQFPPSSRDIGQRSRSQLRSNTGADGSREIVVDVISDTPGRTDWSLVNDVIPTRNTRFRSQPFADTTISFDSIQNDPPRSNLQLQLGSSDFSGTTSLEIAPTDTFDFQSGLNDNLPSRAAPLELAELSSGLDWASLDNFIQQRQNQQLRVGRRAAAAASASAAATNRLPLTSRTQPAPAVQIPGEQLTLGSVNTRQFTIPTAGSNPLTTVDTAGKERRPIFAIVPLNSQASMVDIQNFVEELATSINRAGAPPTSGTGTAAENLPAIVPGTTATPL